MNNLEQILAQESFSDLSIISTILSFLICAAFLYLVGIFYKRNSVSLGAKSHIASVLPLIGLTVFIVITVVKSSLALSLGLVGALSIVRFRTPIKEPEELGYLFLTIAIGLGFGAGFVFITPILTMLTLLILYLLKNSKAQTSSIGQYTFVVSCDKTKYKTVDENLIKLITAIKLTRFEAIGERSTGYYSANLDPAYNLNNLISTLTEIDPTLEIQLVESTINW